MTFDLVTAWDVIEHCTSPLHFLKAARDALRPGGILALTTPDSGSLVARVYGRNWFEYKWPEHLYYLDRHSLLKYFQATGLEVLQLHKAVKVKALGDALARWVGRYEGGRISQHPILGLPVRYSSLSEMIAVARRN